MLHCVIFYFFVYFFFFSNEPPTTEIYPLSLHDALPILDGTFAILDFPEVEDPNVVFAENATGGLLDRKSGSAGMPRPSSYAGFWVQKTPSFLCAVLTSLVNFPLAAFASAR